MQYVIGSIVALATLALAIGAITGRVKNSVILTSWLSQFQSVPPVGDAFTRVLAILGPTGRIRSSEVGQRGSLSTVSTSPVTLPGQATNCVSDDEGLERDVWRDCGPN